MNPILKIHEKDNVATCLKKVVAGDTFDFEDMHITAKEDIPQYHKIALTPISEHGPVLKYGQTIGLATKEILPGEHVHIHNIESTRGRGDQKGGDRI